MGLLFAIIIGVMVGTVASSFFRENFDFVAIDAFIGMAGALLGLGLYFLLGGNEILLFSWSAVLIEVIVAVLMVTAFNLLHKSVTKKRVLKAPIPKGSRGS